MEASDPETIARADAIIETLRRAECLTVEQVVVAGFGFPVLNRKYEALMLELFEESQVDYSSLEDLPNDYTDHHYDDMKRIAETHDHALLMRAALKRKLPSAQRCVLMMMQNALGIYATLTIEQRVQGVLDFWKQVLANFANVETGCNAFWIISSIREIIFERSLYGDASPPDPQHLELGCTAIQNVCVDKFLERVLSAFRSDFARLSDEH